VKLRWLHPVSIFVLMLAGAVTTACPAPTPVAPENGRARPTAIPPRVELMQVEHRPPISLVARLGDPFPAVAAAIRPDHGSRASAALAVLLRTRLARAGFPNVRQQTHHLGLQLQALLGSAEDAGRFVTECARALNAPYRADAEEAAAIADAWGSLSVPTWSGTAEAAVAECSGEFGMATSGGASSPVQATEIERWRNDACSTNSVAFAALGPPQVLEAATEALRATPEWPERPAPQDPWPRADVVGADRSGTGPGRLSVALRVADASAALEAARTLAQPGSALLRRLNALSPPWQLTRVVGTTRPRGACVRVDLAAEQTAPPNSHAVADVAELALQETRLALAANHDGTWSLEQSVLRPPDPSAAAAVAAWRALSGTLHPGEARRFIAYVSNEALEGEASLARALGRADQRWKRPTLERRARVEPGQGELWALVASPCGTANESAKTAGAAAAFVTALATKLPVVEGVSIEPWITPDGIGLLAHGAPTDPYEQPTAHARRVGSALGQALGAARIEGEDQTNARNLLLQQVGTTPRPGWWLTLNSLAPQRPSWLEPRGTWQALTELAGSAAEGQRQHFLQGPLRIAVLANWSEAQVPATVAGLQRWLRPLREEQRQCPAVSRSRPRSGVLRIDTSAPDRPPAGFVAVPMPGGTAAERRQAEWTLWLLNREGGWLQQALRAPGLASSARAHLVGGRRGAALIVELSASKDQIDQAVAQVRGLMKRLAQGAASKADVQQAVAHFAVRDRSASLDPRHRIVELWQGSSTAPAPDLASLRKLHRRVFHPDTHLVVIATPRA
jgi:hypothetical protein